MTKTTRDESPDPSQIPPVSTGSRGPDWQGAYQTGTTPWDLRGLTEPLRHLAASGFFASTAGLSGQARVAVPMCGRGHDLRVFAEIGYRVTGFDLAPAAIEEARSLQQLNGYQADLLVRDVLGLSEEFAGGFELVYDYTSFCALPPHLRRRYLVEMAGILAPGGHLLMLAFPLRAELAGAAGRPPFLVEEAELQQLTAPQFELLDSFAASDSPPERQGAERWFHFRKHGRERP